MEILEVEECIAVGLISGTSMDGVDVCVVKIREKQSGHLSFNVVHYATYDFPLGLKDELLKICIENTSIHIISQVNVLVGRVFGEAVLRALKECGIAPNKVKLVGSHGQTVYHQSVPELFHGHYITSTLQIGDPSTIAVITGITTVGDFRMADMACGGQGAPLVPYLDQLLAKYHYDNTKRVGIFLNIGGISNIFAINPKTDYGIGFDTGPGNILIDGLMKRLYDKEYDEDGCHGARGTPNKDLLQFLIDKDSFITKAPPKSTGREYYNHEYIEEIICKSLCLHVKDEDIISTVTAFTAHTVYLNYTQHVKSLLKGVEVEIDLFISGGGAKNTYLISCLKEMFNQVTVTSTDVIGIPIDCKEALCFAILGYQTINHRPTNVPSVTGAQNQVILGKICPI